MTVRWRAILAVTAAMTLESSARADDAAPIFTLGTFGSLTFAHSDGPDMLAVRDVPPPHPSFYLGQVILFGTGRISDHADVLIELGIETSRESIGLDPERAYVQYAFGDYLRLWAGRFHSHMGYFNNAYHHGQYLYSTAFRPRTLAWEDMGGILPIHLVGLSAGGRVALSDALWLRYAADFGNARADRPDSVAGGPDYSTPKTVVGQLALELPALGMEWGVSAEVSRIPGLPDLPASASPDETTDLRENILGAHFAWVKSPVEAIVEVYREEHVPSAAALRTSRVWGGFAQLGYDIDGFRPYARFERISIATGATDPYFARSEEGPGIPASFSLLTTGLRYEVAAGLVVKLEYERQVRPVGVNIGLLQVAWGL